MEELTIVRATQIPRVVGSFVYQWDAWDSEGNYWYLRFQNGHGSLSKDYDVATAVRSFYFSNIVSVSLERLCDLLGIRLDLDSDLDGIELKSVTPETQKITIDIPRPGYIKLIISNEGKWASVEVENWRNNFAGVMHALTEMERGITE